MKNILFVNKEKARDKNFHLLRLNFPFQRYELVPSYTFSYQPIIQMKAMQIHTMEVLPAP